MELNQPSLTFSKSDDDIIEKLKEDYLTAITKSLSLQLTFEPEKLKTEHTIIVDMLTSKFEPEDKEDLSFLLDTYWSNIIVKQDTNTSHGSQSIDDAYTYMYFSTSRVYVAAFTRKLGNVDINFGTPHQKQNYVPLYMEYANGKLLWGNDFDNFTEERKSNNTVIIHLRKAKNGSKSAKKMVIELLQKIKDVLDESTQESTSHLTLAVASRQVVEVGELLRECCQMAGFARVLVLSDSFLATYRLFSRITVYNKPETSVGIVLVSFFTDKIWIEVYECDFDGTKINSIQILTSAITSTKIDSVKRGYERAIAKITKAKRDSIRYHMLLHGNFPSIIRYFRDEQKFKTIDRLTADNFLEVLAYFRNGIEPFKALLGFPKAVPTVAGSTSNKFNDYSDIDAPHLASADCSPSTLERQNTVITHGGAKLPLKICLSNGRIYKILAWTNWTGMRLKEELQKYSGQQGSGSFVLNYKEKMLRDDSLLSAYQMHPDSIIQATSTRETMAANEPPNIINLQIQETVTGSIQLIGNCLALQNGSESIEVKGVKRGTMVLARTDLDNLTVGEVGMTCQINGFGDIVYVGVKFRKQLPLGKSGIQIQHVAGGEGFCDKCKGRKSLFIPSEHVGRSKDQLFQVE